jgi:hypothetical protein
MTVTPFLRDAYIIATVVAVVVILLLSPWSMYIFRRYIGRGAYLTFAMACVVWCATFILVGLLLTPNIEEET